MKTTRFAITFLTILYSSLMQIFPYVQGQQQVSYVWDKVQANRTGTFGVRGLASPVNLPPGRKWSSSTTDTKRGILYVFGGMGNTIYNDLWQYNVTYNLWTWIAGTGGAQVATVYGALPGAYALGQGPGGRFGSVLFYDETTESLFLFGGFGYTTNSSQPAATLSDLWQFDLRTSQWAWLTKTNVPYTTCNVAGFTWYPCGRSQAAHAFDPVARELYVFGGFGTVDGATSLMPDFYQANGGDLLQDAWKMKVSGTTTSDTNVTFTRLPVNSSTNFVPYIPARRQFARGYFDSKTKAFYVFGGTTGGESAVAEVDLWKLDSTSGWSCVSTSCNAEFYFSVMMMDETLPQRRIGNFFTDARSNETSFLIFGGKGNGIYFNDVWQFSTASSVWSLISDQNVAPIEARSDFATFQLDNTNTILVFGGHSQSSYSFLNDLWRLKIVLPVTTTIALQATTIVQPKDKNPQPQPPPTVPPFMSAFAGTTTVTSTTSPGSSVVLSTVAFTTSVYMKPNIGSTSEPTVILVPTSEPAVILNPTSEPTTILKPTSEPTASLEPTSTPSFGTTSDFGTLSDFETTSALTSTSDLAFTSDLASTSDLEATSTVSTPSLTVSFFSTITRIATKRKSTITETTSNTTSELTIKSYTEQRPSKAAITSNVAASSFYPPVETKDSGSPDNFIIPLSLPLMLVIIGVSLAIISGILGFGIYHLFRQYKKRQEPYQAPELTSRTNLTASRNALEAVYVHRATGSQTKMSSLSAGRNTMLSAGSAGTTTRMTNTSGMNTITATSTVVPGQRELAIPGFIKFVVNADFTIGRELAKGGGGNVHIGACISREMAYRNGSRDLIVKTIAIVPGKEESALVPFYQEVSVMWFLVAEKNIAKIVGYCEEPFAILMKHYPLGSMDQLLHHQNDKPHLQGIRYTNALVLKLARDIVRGLQAIHNAGFVHSDLKPPNLLLDRDQQGALSAVITDFGFTNVVSRQALLVNSFPRLDIQGLSLCYAAPEQLNGTRDTSMIPVQELQSVDLFAFGVVFGEMAVRSPPWLELRTAQDLIRCVHQGLRPYQFETIPRVMESSLRGIIPIIQACWAHVPARRPHIEIVAAMLQGLEQNQLQQ